mmetsp:Transcript_7875/g.29171  ORF Transcript_7875/g.29171 Transcript_7875/m.29171 type:complete len:212 (-) Transcript_7875:148-783(-)
MVLVLLLLALRSRGLAAGVYTGVVFLELKVIVTGPACVVANHFHSSSTNLSSVVLQVLSIMKPPLNQLVYRTTYGCRLHIVHDNALHRVVLKEVEGSRTGKSFVQEDFPLGFLEVLPCGGRVFFRDKERAEDGSEVLAVLSGSQQPVFKLGCRYQPYAQLRGEDLQEVQRGRELPASPQPLPLIHAHFERHEQRDAAGAPQGSPARKGHGA